LVRINKSLLLIVVALVCVAMAPMLQGQSATSDEIKIASQPYIPEANGTIKVQSTIVDLTVVVRDANGKLVTGLKKEDFEILDQGKKQTVSGFNVELAHPPATKVPEHVEAQALPPAPPAPVPPRLLGFYFDDQNMSSADLVFARKAAEGFVNKHMEPTDRAGVFTSSTTVTQQFTSSKQQILDTLTKLVSHQRSATFGATSCPRITPYEAFLINQTFDSHSDVFDLAVAQAVQCNCQQSDASCPVEQARLVQTQAATVLSLSEQFAQDSLGVLGDVIRYMGRTQGRRMLIMASSGFFSRTDKVQHAQDKMIDSALKAGIVINTLDAKGLAADWVGGNPADGPANTVGGANGGAFNALQDEVLSDEREVSNDSMQVLASSTGGKFFHNSNDLEGGLVEIAALPEVSYALSFAPDDLKENGSYHTLKVRVPGMHDVTISTRPGYFAQSNEKNSPSAKFQKLTKEVMAADTLNNIAASVTTQSGTVGSGETALKVNVHVSGKSLSFKKETTGGADSKSSNLRVGRLIFITALFDLQGRYLGGVEAVMDMNLKDASFAQISKDGVDARSTLEAPPGTYRLREVVQDVVGGKLAASSSTVEIH
jgi:VWFA-related protein